jgi:thiol-disulfide isomerase/thioredoxin
MKIKHLVFLSFLTILLFSGCDKKEKISQEVVVKTKAVPEFNLKTTTNSTLKIIAHSKGWQFKGLEGKVVLLDFFGTWCPPCKAEIPHLNDIREKIKDKFEIVGIDIGSRGGEPTSDEDMAQFIKKFDIKYIISNSGDNIKLYQALGELNPRGSIPFMVLLNQKGQYVTHYIGMVPQEMMQSDIDKLLEK